MCILCIKRNNLKLLIFLKTLGSRQVELDSWLTGVLFICFLCFNDDPYLYKITDLIHQKQKDAFPKSDFY